MQNDSLNQIKTKEEGASLPPPEKDVQTKRHTVRNIFLSTVLFAGSILGTYGILSVITPKKVAQSSVSSVTKIVAVPEKGTIGSVEADIAADKKAEEQVDDSLISRDIEDIQAEAISAQSLEGDYGNF